MSSLLGCPGCHCGAIVELPKRVAQALPSQVLFHAEVEDPGGADDKWKPHGFSSIGESEDRGSILNGRKMVVLLVVWDFGSINAIASLGVTYSHQASALPAENMLCTHNSRTSAFICTKIT